jgi:adenosyl cobinamide kinase/adenosyl cobinamide phosphate guanylyltransferase
MKQTKLEQFIDTDDYKFIEKLVSIDNLFEYRELISALFNSSEASKDYILLDEIIYILDVRYYGRSEKISKKFTHKVWHTLRVLMRAASPYSIIIGTLEVGWGVSNERSYWMSRIFRLKTDNEIKKIS